MFKSNSDMDVCVFLSLLLFSVDRCLATARFLVLHTKNMRRFKKPVKREVLRYTGVLSVLTVMDAGYWSVGVGITFILSPLSSLTCT